MGENVQEVRTEEALVLGNAEDIAGAARMRPGIAEAEHNWPTSESPRGLVLKRLTIDRDWDKVAWMFKTENEIFFTSVAYDFGGDKPVVLPPDDVDIEHMIYRLRKGQSIDFTWGEGAPLFPPRRLVGGLVVYLMVFESDAASRDLGETLTKVHEDLTSDGSIVDKIKALITKPAETLADEAMSIATTALQPLATMLKENNNDFVAPFEGYWMAQGSWSEKLIGARNGVSIELGEIG